MYLTPILQLQVNPVLQLHWFVLKPKQWEKEQFQWILKSVTSFFCWLKTRLTQAIQSHGMDLTPVFGKPVTGMPGSSSVPFPKEQGSSRMEFSRKAGWTQIAEYWNYKWQLSHECSTARGGLSWHQQPPVLKADYASNLSSPHLISSYAFQHYSKYILKKS